ncbi:phosphoserine phosphatase-like [Tropilaelaps mercedesae]|uniref:Phosphoserine phosphatase n=1 Tax=Tropilaelaps mercedesae TaxID=418985 RepID=A0A1V9X6D4_9ACAR|nr:phosphoserine phosphatase-like [Tropilaelaps mercedesae]
MSCCRRLVNIVTPATRSCFIPVLRIAVVKMPSLISQLSLSSTNATPTKMPVQPLSLTEAQTRAMWRAADAVCFDVDSTVCMDEAIDELARFAGRDKEVADLTAKAMKGGMTFREALIKRLDLIQPDIAMVETYIRENPPRLSPGIEELVGQLHARNTAVYLVSGGFQSIIAPVATELSIPHENIYANQLKFYFNGSYAGFNENQPTSYQDGKARVIEYLKKKFGYHRVVMVGDGATDLAACPPADAFIGYGGNQIREKVRAAAPWFVESFDELVQELRKE